MFGDNSWYWRSYEEIRQELESDYGSYLYGRLKRSAVFRGSPSAAAAAELWRQAIGRMLSGSELRTKYDTITGALPDRWQLRQYVFDDC
ncbi:hypothetical protein FJT64_000756 [Amphibalanus amphitrite]|uniref:Uncharacterized protein n=1 Tax=Amphibalanus amphitrite TaxID=1232801 RepID=A0A6A4VIB9_AMPAM|nr:hypothetical protein FJT64_000756 [Amphibalanus amphitrite]